MSLRKTRSREAKQMIPKIEILDDLKEDDGEDQSPVKLTKCKRGKKICVE